MSLYGDYPLKRYGKWAGNPKGYAYVPERCAFEVFPAERGMMHGQCMRKRGHGAQKLFCKQHAQKVSER